MGFQKGHKGFRGKANKLKAGLKEKVDEVLDDQERILETVRLIDKDYEVIGEKGTTITNSGVNNRDVAKVILDYVNVRLPGYKEFSGQWRVRRGILRKQ